MIKIKAGNLISIREILNKLSNTEMPARDSFKVMRILKAIEAEYVDIMNIQNKTLSKYAQLDDNGNFKFNPQGGVILKKGQSQTCLNEINDLYNTVIEIPSDKINIDLFNSIQVTPSQLMAMEELIDYGE